MATSSADATAATSSSSTFTFPREYHFPPFFTRQTQLTTRHAQLTKWSSLILSYARHHRLFRLSLSSASESDLFHNRRLDRRLQPADVREVVDFMRKEGTVEYVSGGGGGGDGSSGVVGGGGKAGAGDVVFVYWRKPDEWAALVEEYVEETAQKGSVLTVYELTEGEGTKGTGKSWPRTQRGHTGSLE
jgi:ESCRT-II complex subunit VPS25